MTRSVHPHGMSMEEAERIKLFNAVFQELELIKRARNVSTSSGRLVFENVAGGNESLARQLSKNLFYRHGVRVVNLEPSDRR